MDFGSLVGAGSTLVGGAAEGIQARKDREARARQQMIENSLRQAVEQRSERAQQSLEEYRHGMLARPKTPPAVRTAAPRLVKNAAGEYVWVTPPTAEPSAGPGAASGQPSAPSAPTQGTPSPPAVRPTGVTGYTPPHAPRAPRAAKPPTPQQQSMAEFGASSLAAWREVDAVRKQNPTVETEVGHILNDHRFLQAVPGFRGVGDAVQAAATAGASPAAQRYLRAKWAFMDNVVRTRMPGGRMSAALFQQYAGEFMPGLDPAANEQVRNNEIQALQAAQGQSGYDTNPSLWRSAAQRHGVGDIGLDTLQQGAGGGRMQRIRSRY